MKKQRRAGANQRKGQTIGQPSEAPCNAQTPAIKNVNSWSRLVIGVIIFALIVAAGGWISGGKSGVEKSIIRLVQPVGLLWLFFSSWCVQVCGHPVVGCWRAWTNNPNESHADSATGLASASQRAAALASASTWLIFMMLTTSPFCTWCVWRLESSLESFRPEENPPLDAVVVLGGGTHQGPWRAELAGAGDRVMYAAQLYLQGHTKQLITTGDASPGVSKDLTSPREHTIDLWTKLKIPNSAIGTLHGKNTFQELQDLKKNWSQFENGRIGLLTSALHLPRAMRLARAQGLELYPIAADHLYAPQPLNYLDFIPSAGPLTQLAACQHEFMAWLVNR